MKYVDEFRDPALARGLAESIAQRVQAGRVYRLMEFCGGHTHAIARHGLPDLLPPSVQLIHGPGCPVCVLPMGRLDQAIALAQRSEVILCSYGDALRVPGSNRQSLQLARAQGADVRMVISPLDALRLAKAHPDREVVFLALGFETTTPPTALTVLQAEAQGVRNFSLLCNHVLTPAAMNAILESPEPIALDGFLGPAHVSTVIGSEAYAPIAQRHHKPIVITGFEPLDVLQAIGLLIDQIHAGEARVQNQFTRAVRASGNARALDAIDRVFTTRAQFPWRGLGHLPHSALTLRPRFAHFDAEQRFGVPDLDVPDHKACECAAVLRGAIAPQDCRIFGTGCTPDHPIGACMVSSEGACAAQFTYGRWRERVAP